MTTKQQTTFRVEGMSCEACVRHVNQALRQIDGVREVDVQLRERKAVVSHDNASVDAMREALREAGYEAAVVG